MLEQLDYESEKDYSLSVRVTDRGVPYHEDTCTVSFGLAKNVNF